jgi:hypothetical protein
MTTLGDLLGVLCRSEVRGILELVEDAGPAAGRTHRLHIDRGRLHFIESALGAKRFGEMLVAKGLLSRARQIELTWVLEDNPNKTVGQCLVELNWVSPRDVRETAREQTTARLSALYQLKDARVAFHIARPMPPELTATPALTANEILQGRPRIRDRKLTADEAQSASSAPDDATHSMDSRRRRALLLLGLETHADTTDVKRAFRRMAAKLHPDRHLVEPRAEQELARQRFSQVTEAYHLLTG